MLGSALHLDDGRVKRVLGSGEVGEPTAGHRWQSDNEGRTHDPPELFSLDFERYGVIFLLVECRVTCSQLSTNDRWTAGVTAFCFPTLTNSRIVRHTSPFLRTLNPPPRALDPVLTAFIDGVAP